MFRLIKKSIFLLKKKVSFSVSLATKYLFLDDETWTVRSTGIGLNPGGLEITFIQD